MAQGLLYLALSSRAAPSGEVGRPAHRREGELIMVYFIEALPDGVVAWRLWGVQGGMTGRCFAVGLNYEFDALQDHLHVNAGEGC